MGIAGDLEIPTNGCVDASSIANTDYSVKFDAFTETTYNVTIYDSDKTCQTASAGPLKLDLDKCNDGPADGLFHKVTKAASAMVVPSIFLLAALIAALL